MHRLIVGLTGMPGAGKSLVVKVARGRGYGIVVMGNAVREEVERRGLALTPENLGSVMLELRQQWGNRVIAKRCIPKILGRREAKILVDGIRSLDEAREFKTHFPNFHLIAIHSSPETRFTRLFRRQRSDDSPKWAIFHARDMRELGVGLGSALAMAEYLIVNEEPLDMVKAHIREVLNRLDYTGNHRACGRGS